jgi:hypothetical protein
MRLVITIAALLVSFTTANATVADRFKCHLSEFQNLTAYGPRDASNSRKNYEIIMLERSIQAVFEENGQRVAQEYLIVGETPGEILGVKANAGSIEGITVSKHREPQYEMRFLITMTVQGGSVVKAWFLLCSQGN